MFAAVIILIKYLPVLAILAYLFCIYSYLCAGNQSKKLNRIGTVTMFAIYLVGAIMETGAQYAVWSGNEVSRNFLPPATPIVYFLQYSFTHFWFGHLIGIVLAMLFYAFLRVLAKRRPWLFLDGETELGLVLALVAGWPGFVIFLPVVFIVMLQLTLFRQFVMRQERTTMGAAFLLAAGVVLVLGNYLINILGLGVLRI